MTRGAFIGGAVWACVMFPTAYFLGFAFEWRLALLFVIASVTDKLLDGPR